MAATYPAPKSLFDLVTLENHTFQAPVLPSQQQGGSSLPTPPARPSFDSHRPGAARIESPGTWGPTPAPRCCSRCAGSAAGPCRLAVRSPKAPDLCFSPGEVSEKGPVPKNGCILEALDQERDRPPGFSGSAKWAVTV